MTGVSMTNEYVSKFLTLAAYMVYNDTNYGFRKITS